MKVLLLNAPPVEGINLVREGRCQQRTGAWTAVWAPVSLATAAAVLREKGMDPRIVDGSVEDIDHVRLEALIRDWQPGLVVINTSTPSIDTDLQIAGLAKRAFPEAKTMAIGLHVSALTQECFDMAPDLDMLVRGEPEHTVLDAALAVAGGTPQVDVRGLSWRAEGGDIIHNERRPFIDNLDELPFPAWDLVDTGLYRLPFSNKRFLLVASARGCPYACTFCANKVYYGARLRKRSPERIVDEMEWVGREFGVTDFLIWSESFTNDQEYAIATAREIIRRSLKVAWVCNSRVDTVSRELLRTIKQAGCWMIGFGIESGDQAVLDRVRKGTTLQQARDAVRMAHEEGLEVTGHSIVGFPGETEETIKKTINFTKSLKLEYVQYYCAVAFPGSPLYDQCIESGWLDEADWRYFEQNFSVINTPELSAGQVMKMRDHAFRAFYLQPYVVVNTIKKIRRPRDVANFARMIRDFLGWV